MPVYKVRVSRDFTSRQWSTVFGTLIVQANSPEEAREKLLEYDSDDYVDVWEASDADDDVVDSETMDEEAIVIDSVEETQLATDQHIHYDFTDEAEEDEDKP